MYKHKLFFFLLLVLIGSCKVNHLADQQTQFYRIQAKDYGATDPEVEALIAPYKVQLDEEMNTVIGEIAQEFRKEQPESRLGNWFADAIYVQTTKYTGLNIDFAAQNYGGMRIPSIAKGPITKGKVYELMPFDNMVVVLELKGAVVMQLLERIAGRGGWPISKQLRFEINNEKIENVKIKGNPLDLEKTYLVSLPDYIANGGDKCFFLREQKRTETGKLVRDALLEYITDCKNNAIIMDAKLDGRIQVTKSSYK